MRTALVLGGGGARGSYQIGVWQALIELDIKIDIVTGTSVGALNSALIAMGDFENALTLWKSIKTSVILDTDIDEKLPQKQKIHALIRQFIVDYTRQGGTDAYPLKKLIDQYSDEVKIRNSPVDCGIVVFDKKTLKPLQLFKEEIEEGKLNDYLLASSSLFPLMKSCKIGEIDFIDGGYYDNIPVELAMKKNADRVIAVDLDAIGMVRKHTFEDVENLTFIKSYWQLGTLLIFDNEQIMQNIRLGYLDTMKTFGAFEGIAYTFIKDEIKADIRKNRDVIKKLNDTLDVKYARKSGVKEDMFHVNISLYLKRKYKRDVDSHYATFFQACMESAGEILDIDFTKIYSVERFKCAIIEKINQLEIPLLSDSETNNPKNLKQALSLLDKKVRMVYLATIMKKEIYSAVTVDLLGLSLLLPDEFLGAYYIALLD